MTPYEILLSESQERMLIIVTKGREEEVKRIFDKWDLPWAEIGFVTDSGQMVVKNHGEVVADLPASKLADDAPIYHREAKEPAYLAEVRSFTLAAWRIWRIPPRRWRSCWNGPASLRKLGLSPVRSHGARQHDGESRQRRRGDSHQGRQRAGGDDREDFPEKLVALAVDCNASHVYLDPYEGSKAAVAECAATWPAAAPRRLGPRII